MRGSSGIEFEDQQRLFSLDEAVLQSLRALCNRFVDLCFRFGRKRGVVDVSMDMWKPYRSAVRAKLPHAQIVADRCHVTRKLNHQTSLLRRALQKKAEGPLAEALKGTRYLRRLVNRGFGSFCLQVLVEQGET